MIVSSLWCRDAQIHEEFDVQDPFFQGEHEPWKNFFKGLQGQLTILGITAVFLGAAWLTYNDNDKPPKRELPPDVKSYLETAGWDRVKSRPYETPKHVPVVTQMPADMDAGALKTSGHH
jgi:hypothetical protein